MIEETLKELGLNEREAKIYVSLLKEKLATASKLAKISKVNRTTAYLELENLMEMGLVSYVIKDSKRYYQAASPEKLLEKLDAKREKLLKIIPEIEELKETAEPFKIEVFEGKEGIKTFYQDVINSGVKEILVLGATGKAIEVLEYSYPNFLKKFIKAGIKERAIANEYAKKIMEKHPKASIKSKYLPKKYSSQVTTIIYGNKIAIQSLVKENIYVVVMSDKLLFESYKNFFEYMWEVT